MTRRRLVHTIIALFAAILFTTTAYAQEGVVVRRCALDIGSANIKCAIADVDITTGTIVNVVEELSRKVDFAEDMARSYDGNLSHEILDAGMAAMQELKQIAREHKASAYAAVGGAIFQEARNGRAYLATLSQETGIKCRLISEQQAALISYHAVAVQRTSATRQLLVWDIGGGWQQMTMRGKNGALLFYIDPLASVSFKNIVIEKIQGNHLASTSTPNPLGPNVTARALEMVTEHALSKTPRPITSHIQRGGVQVVGIGGVHYYSIPALISGAETGYTREQILEALNKWMNASDKDLNDPYASTRVTNLCLVLGYMNALGIEEILPMKINQADGLLVTPEYW